MKRIYLIFLALCLSLIFFALTSCENDAKSAYELYKENNPEYTGSLSEWLESLNGKDGKSAYELYREANPDYTGSLSDWLKIMNGKNGKSAYELYCEVYPDYEETEDEWLTQLVNGTLRAMHTVTFNPANGNEAFTSQVSHGEKAQRPAEPTRAGYTFLGWYYDDGVEEEKWSFVGYSVTKDIALTAKWDYATYELPIININTNGAGINSKEVYTDMTFSLENCEDELIEVSGGIRLRGNSTMGFDKKPYRIKFDKKQSLFGLDKAKSWVLLAEYLDPSALHNFTAFNLASQMPGLGFTPTPHKVNIYLNGVFVGLYTLCEQVQENEGRIDIELDEITADMTDLKDFNFFICMDRSAAADSSAILGETYFYIEEYDQYFELKYPEKDQFTSDAQFESFFSQLQVYTKEILDAFNDKDIEKIEAEANINSLIDFLIVDMIMGEHDHHWKSFNMYYTNTSSDAENGRLSFGPVWDYDWSLNTPFTGVPNQHFVISDEMYYSNIFFTAMAQIPQYYEQIEARYNQYAKPALEEYIDNLDSLQSSMEQSLILNHNVWYSNISADLTDKNIAFLKEFLEKRKIQLDAAWSLE
jgi:uncharacterized repeat protein (TIGR02543 family)